MRAVAVFSVLLFSIGSFAQQPAPKVRITQQVDPSQRVTLPGNTHPLARAEFDRGPAPDSMIANRMLLLLSRSDEQEKALRQLLDDQQTKGSPNYHKWLTPEEFGEQFGAADVDVQTVTTWLLNNGFQVTDVAPGKNVIEFSGTAGQLRQTFHTDLHKYNVKGEEHWANANDPQIPAALAPVVKGIASLNNFSRRPHSHKFKSFKRDLESGQATPLVTTGGSPPYYLLGPGDFAVIYGSNPLLTAGTKGAGQKIAIVGRTNINLQDVTDFRTLFGLPMTPDNHTSVLLNGAF
jgi:subtilase family serine protease